MKITNDEMRVVGQLSVLRRFSQAFTREMYVLPTHPELLWQQLSNRLQWEDQSTVALVESETGRRATCGSKPWVKMKTPFPESRALLASFSKAGINKDAVFSLDGQILFCWETQEGVTYKRAFNVFSGAEMNPPENMQAASRTRSLGRIGGELFRSWDGRFSIEAKDTTPKLFLDIIESILKISYRSFPNRISLMFQDREKHRHSPAATLWSLQVLADGRRMNDGVSSCAFSPDGRHAATCLLSRNRSIYIWDMNTGRRKRRLKNQNYSVTACGFSPDGKRIVTAGYDEPESAWLLRVWEIRSGRCVQIFRGHRGGEFEAKIEFCEYSPDGTMIVSGGREQPLLMWDASDMSRSDKLPNHAAPAAGCQFSADGEWVVSSGGSTIVIREPLRGAILKRYTHPQKPGKKLLKESAVSSDRRWIAAAVEVSKPLNPYETWTHICVWDTNNGRRVHTLKGSKKLPVEHRAWKQPERTTRHFMNSCGEFHPRDATFISFDYGTVVIWDAIGGRPLRTLDGFIQGRDASVRYSPDGNWIGIASNVGVKHKKDVYVGEIDIFDAESGTKTLTLAQDEGEISCLGFSPDGNRFVSGGKNGEIKLWERDEGSSELKFPGHIGSIRFCDFFLDGQFILSAGIDQWIRIWRQDGTLVTSMPFPQDIISGDVHLKKASFVFGDRTGYVHLFDLVGLG